MRKFFSFVAVAIAALSLSLTACTEDPAKSIKVEITEGQSATVSGTLLINPNVTAGYDQKYSGVEADVIVTVPYADILDDSSAKGNWATIVKSNGSGEFSVTVPTNTKGVTVSFTVSDVKGTQKQTIGGEDKNINGVWTFNVTDENEVKAGKVIVKEHTVGNFKPLKADGDKV